MSFCSCREFLVDRGEERPDRVPCPPYHDCDYVKERSALVSRAAALASEECHRIAANPGTVRYDQAWNVAFGQHMERLARPLVEGRAA